MRTDGLVILTLCARLGQEDAQDLLKRYGPSFFSKEGRGLDDIAQELDGMGIHVGGEAGLFNLLMSEAVPESPITLAKEEARREVMDKYREQWKRIKEKTSLNEKEGKAELKALKKKLIAEYEQLENKLEAKYEAMTERQQEHFASKKRAERTARLTKSYLRALSGQIVKRDNKLRKDSLYESAKTAARNKVAGMTIQSFTTLRAGCASRKTLAPLRTRRLGISTKRRSKRPEKKSCTPTR